MNKHLYRVIFNRTRGQLMVVAEKVPSYGKAGSSASTGPGAVAVTLNPLRYALMLGLFLPSVAAAEIVADTSAPAGQQPTVITTANGVPQVDIQTPSAAGVSRNTYRQFDVDNRGAILNNSRTHVQTQLGGWITGNQRLNKGTARIILNEVNSSAASHLNGYIEVAGDRAQVVIANPAGISCDGCGFINADRATLTTGAPIMNKGHLDGYTISRGEISIQGAGLDGRNTTYTDIIARSVRINAGIWANDLKITTGSNQVNADHTQVTPFDSSGDKPKFAIDVAHLGGMYAGKIRLVGTEHGVGVRNAGVLAAESGDLVVTLDGRLENTGLLQGKGDIRLAVQEELNNDSGTIATKGSLAIEAGTLSNHEGLIAAFGEAPSEIDVAGQVDNADGVLASAGDLTLKAGDVFNANGLLHTAEGGNLRMQVEGTLDNASNGALVGGDSLHIISGRLINQGDLEAATLHVQATDIDNTVTGAIGAEHVLMSATSTLSNRGLIDGRQVRLEAGQLENAGTGQLYGDHLAIQAQTLINREETVGDTSRASTIAARERMDIGTQTLLNSDQALIFSAGLGEDALNIGGALDESGWAIGSADLVHNASAIIESLGGLNLATTRLLNSNEYFETEDVLTLGPTRITYIRPSGDSNKYTIDNFVWRSWSRAGYYAWKDDPAPSDTSVLGKSPVPRVGENDCVGEGMTEVCTRLPGADYLPDDPAWAYFKLQAPAEEPSAPDSSDFANQADYEAALAEWHAAHAAWQAETDALYELLDARIAAYNDQFDDRKIKNWTQYQVTRTEHTTQVTQSAPALIRSGGGMHLSGDVLINDKSRIVVGGALTGDLTNLQNIDGIGTHRVHETGTSQYTYSRWRGGFKRYHERRWDSTVSYKPADVVTTINLDVVSVEKGGASAGTGYQVPTQGSETADPVDTAWDLPTSSLFQVSPGSGSYLVETDPRFTNQRTWLNSDYLLGQLSLDAAGMQQRIGDGFVEQWLIREQVSQLTGRRYLEGYADDEAQYHALMEAGATVAQEWDLRPGVALTAEQVARLTSDIVWLVEETVRLPDGTLTTALVPKVYLVPREGDLDGNGTLISAESIDLRLEGDLVNGGTLAGRSIVQLSGDNLRNLGGRITGEDVLLQARTDLDNLGGRLDAQDNLLLSAGRDVTVASTTHSEQSAGENWSASRTNLDRVAGLYVSNPGGTLVVVAGQDVSLAGAEVVNAGADSQTLLAAGRDLTLAAVQTENQHSSAERAQTAEPRGLFAGLFPQRPASTHSESQSQDIGTTLRTGGDLTLQAGGDLFALAAQVHVGGHLQATAGGDLLIVAGRQNASYSLDGKGVTVAAQSGTQRSSGFNATGDMLLTAGNDLLLVASELNAGGDGSLTAGNDLALLAGQNYSYSLSEHEHRGSFGRRSYKRDEVTDLTHVGSRISGNSLTLQSGGDQRYQAANLHSDGDLRLDSGGAIAFEGVKDLHQEDHISSSNDWSWLKSSGKGWTDETLRQSALVAQGNLVIKALEGIRLDIKEIDAHSISQAIDAMVAAEPQLAWLKELEQRGDIDWQRVKELHDAYAYDQQGMGPATALAVAIVVSAATYGAASSLVGSVAGAAAGSGSTMAAGAATTTTVAGATTSTTVAAGWGNVMAATAFSSAASNTAISAIQHQGDLDKIFKDVFSEDSLKHYASSAMAAGISSYTSGWGRGLGAEGNYTLTNSHERFAAYALNTATKGLLIGDDTTKSWATIAGLGALSEIYEYSAGRGPDVRPGVDREQSDFAPLEENFVPRVSDNGYVREGKNIGLNLPIDSPECQSFYSICHGTPASNLLNNVPGFNSFATLHDSWMVSLESMTGSEMNWLQNIGTMPPALLINYGALYDKHMHIIEMVKDRY